VDVTTAVALVLQAVSLAALGLAVRQNRLAGGANHLPVVLEAFQHSRGSAWLEAQEYVLTRLADECPIESGYSQLPPSARSHVNTIGLFYDDLGKLVAHGMIGEDLVIGSYGMPIVWLWDALAPYAYAERRLHGLDFWVYFEDLAERTASTTPAAVYARLALRSRPPRAQAGC
jgi:hypothetical protein